MDGDIQLDFPNFNAEHLNLSFVTCFEVCYELTTNPTPLPPNGLPTSPGCLSNIATRSISDATVEIKSCTPLRR